MQGCTLATQTSAAREYRPRTPRATALYQCTARHAPELKAGGRFRRRVEENVIGRFLECGDPQHGFARIRCGQCRYACILPFSCKARYFCPSCHQKRVLAYGEWVEANVLAPVLHRQYVFTIPRLLRPMFARRRVLLGNLCNIVERLFARFYASARPGARPGIILFVQTFGDLVNFNPGQRVREVRNLHTEENFRKLQPGMTHQEVAATIGITSYIESYAFGTTSWRYRYRDAGIAKLLHVVFDSGNRLAWYYWEWDPEVYSKGDGFNRM